MESAKKETGIIFVDKNFFYFYSSNHPDIISFTFEGDVVKDFDLISREKLSEQIKLFLDQNKIFPINLVLIFSENASFNKDLVLENENLEVLGSAQKDIQKEKNEDEIQKFIDNVPLENTCVKIFNFDKATRITVVNKDFLETIKDIFEKNGFKIIFAIPAFSLIRLGIQPNIGFSQDTAKVVIQKSDSIKQDDMLDEEKKEEVKTKSAFDKKKPLNKKEILLIIIFILLFIVFVILLIRTRFLN